MSQQKEKTYINGLFIKKVTFSNGEIINLSINVDNLFQQLNELKNEKGYVNIVFKNRKEADKNGNNMYAELNTYTPKEKDVNNEDDLPF